MNTGALRRRIARRRSGAKLPAVATERRSWGSPPLLSLSSALSLPLLQRSSERISADATEAGARASVIGAEVGAATSEKERSEERAKESWQKRAEVYAKYLAALEAYSSADEDLGFRSIQNRDEPTDKHHKELNDADLYRDNSEIALVAQINQVFVYGSDQAWAAHEAILVVLQRAERGALTSDSAYKAAYTNFQNVFCREASAQPREGCKIPVTAPRK